jgi:tetratricopeptide (TPR) repeat protein
MKRKLRFYLIQLIIIVSVYSLAFCEASSTLSGTSQQFTEADSVLSEARVNIGDTASANQRITKLEGVLKKYPGYPDRPEVFYYTGLNAQLCGQNNKAIQYYKAALKEKPLLAAQTSIVAYLKSAENIRFSRQVNFILIALLIITLIPALWRLTSHDAISLPWKKIFAVYSITVVVYAASVFLLPLLFGSMKSGLEAFPRPTLSNFHMGQIGDQPLMALLLYGIGAILITLPVVVATSRLKNIVIKNFLTIAGCILVVGSVMGLYGIRYLFLASKYNSKESRLVFMARSINSMKEVPDVMFPLYEEAFVKRILNSRKQEK